LARQAGLILRVVDADLAIIKGCGLAGHVATTYEQVGYSVADVVAKAVFGVLIGPLLRESPLRRRRD
jgi:hypothetical protein